MSLLVDLEPLLPSEAETAARADALIGELERQPARGKGRPRAARWRGPTLATAAVAGLLAALVIPHFGGADAVESARAAIGVPRDGILHVKVRYEHGPYVSTGSYWDGDPRKGGRVVGRTTGDSERWTAPNPWRQRDVQFLATPDGGQATIQTAVGPTTLSTRNSWDGRTSTERLSPDEAARIARGRAGARVDLASVAAGFGEDPVGAIRLMLQADTLQSDGTVDVGGRVAIRLVGNSPGFRDAGGSWSPRVEWTYLVDQESYAPLQVTSVQVLPARPRDPEPAAREERRIVQRWIFEVFERLPLNEQTEQLLEIDPNG